MSERDKRIDIMRASGILLIILAHCSPPSILFQLRNFDVPLIVMISGAAYAATSGKRSELAINYIGRRLLRLLAPVWTFLLGYFVITALVIDFPYTWEQVAGSFVLLKGIGFVWIFRVFGLIAIATPLLGIINSRLQSNRQAFALAGFSLLFAEVLRWLIVGSGPSAVQFVLEFYVLYLLSYGAMFLLGMRLCSLSKSERAGLGVFSFVIFVSLFGWFTLSSGEIVPTQRFKYPPSIYYFSFALFMTLAYWQVVELFAKQIERFPGLNNLVLRFSKRSMWIYLWHIPMLNLIKGSFLVQYLIVVLLSYAAASLQEVFVKRALSSPALNPRVKRYISLGLT